MPELRGYTDLQDIENNFFVYDLTDLVLANKFQDVNNNLSGSLLFKKNYNGLIYFEVTARQYADYETYTNMTSYQFFNTDDLFILIEDKYFPDFTAQEIIDFLEN